MWRATHGDGVSFYGDSPDTVCSQWYSYVKSVNSKTAGDYKGVKNGYCLSTWQGGSLSKIPISKDMKKSMNNQCGSSPAVVKMKGASFSVICTEKAKDTNFGGVSVGSLGGNSSASSNNSASSSSSSSGTSVGGSSGGGSSRNKGNGAGATAGGNGANDAGRAPSAGGGAAQNSSDLSSNKTDSPSPNKTDSPSPNIADSSNSDQGNSGGSDDSGKESDPSSGKSKGLKKGGSDGNSGGGADGNGDGQGSGQYGIPDVPDVPDGGGEPDWGGIKSDGNFGTFSPSSAFAIGGQCPQDILLDFGQFGRHSFSWMPICEAAQRLRYVFITLAYFMAAMMVYKTVNSLRG